MVSDALEPNESPLSDGIEVGASEMAWSQAWQIPVLLLGLGLFVIGVYFAVPRYSSPDFPGVLADVEAHIERDELEQAEEKLETLSNDEVFQKNAGDGLQSHLSQLYGDLRFKQIDKSVWQGSTTDVGQKNLELIAGYYRQAERLGKGASRTLPLTSLRRYAETLAAMGKDLAALEIIDEMPVDMDPPRYVLVRELINRQLKVEPDPTSEKLTRMISRFEKELEQEKDQRLNLQQQIWVTGLKAERMLRAEDPNGVIKLLGNGGLIDLISRDATAADLAPLTVRLGEAYTKLRKYEIARGYLREAQENLPEGHKLHPRVLVAFGDITLAQAFTGYIGEAFHYYLQAYNQDKRGPSSISALIGLGHTEANRDGRFPEALDWFKLAVKRVLSEQLPQWDKRRELLAYYMRDVHVVRERERGRYTQALELLKAYQPLELPKLSASTLTEFATVYQLLGDRSLGLAKELTPKADKPGDDPNLKARRLHNQDAALAYEQAGDYYQRAAAELTHTTKEHGEALWKSAKNYENAQLWSDAVKVYTQFLETNDDDQKLEEASFRVAQALLAEGQSEAAVERFRAIIEGSPTGSWAKPSYVPMAQGLSAMGKWAEAEKLLRSVTEDHPTIGPSSAYFRDALVALGRLYYTRGQKDPRFYARAIEVLGSKGGAIERYSRVEGFEKQMPILHYMLADCLRLSARGLVESADQARTETERLAMLSERSRRLADAKMYYNMVIYGLRERHPDSFSQLELMYFRNSYFYQADCAFDLADYETAIALYLNAVSRWKDHPVALVGWVQIMNARAELNQIEAARLAHARAIELFNQMPRSAFERADSLMTRERWDAWLQWMNQLDLLKTAEADSPD